MSNRLKMVQKELLFLLFSQKWSIRKINKAYSLHRKTITSYYNEWLQIQKQNPQQQSHTSTFNSAQKASKIAGQSVPLGENQVPPDEVVHFEVPTDPEIPSKSRASNYRDLISQKLRLGQSAKSIFQDLVTEYGYTGSYYSIKRYVKKMKTKSPKLYARIETPIGEEAQVDFGEGAPTLKNGRFRKPWLFVMTLSNSRKSYQEVVWKQDVETFIRCHENAFQHFQGVPKVIKHDNLKSAVLKAHLYEPDLNPVYLAFSEHYHFIPVPCRVKTPEHKGKVENNIGYVQDNALKGKKFNSLEEQNHYLRHWDKTWASTRIHGTTKRQVNLMFEEEKKVLQPLPEESFSFFKIGTRKVNALDSHIEIEGAYYPIPPRYMGKYVTVHYNSKWIKAFYQNQKIQFLSTIAKGRFHPDKSCLPPHKGWSQNQYIQYLFEQCSQIGPSVIRWARCAEADRQQRAYRSIQGVVALAKKYPYSVINLACQKSMDHNAISYHVVKNFVDEINIQKQIQLGIQFTQESDIIRSPLEYQNILSGGQPWKS